MRKTIAKRQKASGPMTWGERATIDDRFRTNTGDPELRRALQRAASTPAIRSAGITAHGVTFTTISLPANVAHDLLDFLAQYELLEGD